MPEPEFDYAALPQDAAQWRPELADPRLDVIRRRLSLYYSSLAGWPAPSPGGLPEPPPMTAAAPPAGGRKIDRSKPRMPLGTPQKAPADCLPCRQKSAKPGG